jgi:uncharacterized iron-regulated membrane protein
MSIAAATFSSVSGCDESPTAMWMEAMLNAMYRYLVRLHRWLALAFAAPLFVVIATGLVLSLEPAAQQIRPGRSITPANLDAHLLRSDPDGQARSLSIRTYDNTLTIGGGGRGGRGGSIVIDLRTGERATPAGPGMKNSLEAGWWDIFLVARRMHETLLLDLRTLVTASTIAMLVIVSLGMVLGWPRLRHSLRGWHQCVAWVTLPLLILSPLTALGMAYGITFMSSGPGGPSGGGRVSMRDAVKLIAADHDLANLTSIRQRGSRLMARIYVDGELRGFAITPGKLQPLQRNWPRLLHEGNWGGVLGPAANVLTSIALLLLIVTGITLWIRGARRRWARALTQTTARGEARPSVPAA